MMHQIRRMVGMALADFRGAARPRLPAACPGPGSHCGCADFFLRFLSSVLPSFLTSPLKASSESHVLRMLFTCSDDAVCCLRGSVACAASALHHMNSASLSRWQVPMAPALGLLLHECIYDSYNKRWGEGRELLRLADWERTGRRL